MNVEETLRLFFKSILSTPWTHRQTAWLPGRTIPWTDTTAQSSLWEATSLWITKLAYQTQEASLVFIFVGQLHWVSNCVFLFASCDLETQFFVEIWTSLVAELWVVYWALTASLAKVWEHFPVKHAVIIIDFPCFWGICSHWYRYIKITLTCK